MPTEDFEDLTSFQRLLFGGRSEPPAYAEQTNPLPDLLHSVSSWLRKSGETAEQYAKRVERLTDAKIAGADLVQVLEVLNHLTDLFDAAQDVTNETLAGVLGESKKSPEALASLARWLKGATPAVSSYSKKIQAVTIDGRRLKSRDEQAALTFVLAALGAMKGAIDSLNSNLPLLLRALEA